MNRFNLQSCLFANFPFKGICNSFVRLDPTSRQLIHFGFPFPFSKLYQQLFLVFNLAYNYSPYIHMDHLLSHSFPNSNLIRSFMHGQFSLSQQLSEGFHILRACGP